jgi:hypothetical protein
MLFTWQAGICRYFSEFIVIIGIFRQVSLIKYFEGFGHILRTKVQVHYEAKGGYIWDEGLGTHVLRAILLQSRGLWLRRMTSRHTRKSLGSYKSTGGGQGFLPNALTKMSDT